MTCAICGSLTSLALVTEVKVLKKISRKNYWKTNFDTSGGESLLLLCTKRKTHGISRANCYKFGIIRRKVKKDSVRG